MSTPSNDYNIEITKRPDAPDEWPIDKIELTVTAKDDEAAEAIADNLISLLEVDAKVVHAMEINETYEI